ncbi:MAG: chemotaxis protein CheW [Gammaproteobacteria bacterium]|jgi:chemotaxis-related protein WspB
MAAQNTKLYIQFFIDDDRFALPANDVIAVAPVVSLHKVPQAPDYVAGILNYRNQSVPVIDMTALLAGHSTRNRLSTRIVLIRIVAHDGQQRVIGLLAERVTEVMRIDETKFTDPGIRNSKTKYLGDVMTDQQGILQRLKVTEILPKAAQEMLFN